MIKYIKRKDVDVEKYDFCIKNAVNSRVYAYSWYLDIVAEGQWDILIKGDYEAVMPLPWRRKYGLKYISKPPWTQQLGIFSVNKLSQTVINTFVKSIPFFFVKRVIQFNSQNNLKELPLKDNYILNLRDSYENLFSNFNNNRKRIVKKLENQNVEIIKDVPARVFFESYKSINDVYDVPEKHESTLKQILLSNKKQINIWVIKDKDKIICGLIWLKDFYRLTYLLPFANKKAKKDNLPTLLIDTLIRDFQNSNLVLDFEGSNLDGVARFYRSFGAVLENYPIYNKFFI